MDSTNSQSSNEKVRNAMLNPPTRNISKVTRRYSNKNHEFASNEFASKKFRGHRKKPLCDKSSSSESQSDLDLDFDAESSESDSPYRKRSMATRRYNSNNQRINNHHEFQSKKSLGHCKKNAS